MEYTYFYLYQSLLGIDVYLEYHILYYEIGRAHYSA